MIYLSLRRLLTVSMFFSISLQKHIHSNFSDVVNTTSLCTTANEALNAKIIPSNYHTHSPSNTIKVILRATVKTNSAYILHYH